MKENPYMGVGHGRNSEKRINEMLNSFIDGELPVAQQNDVKQLISQDNEIARKMRQLQKCKYMVGSIPRVKAPGRILTDVKASLASKALLKKKPSAYSKSTGTRHLMARKVLSAAAMISLVAVLSAVIYTIVAPETITDEKVVVVKKEIPDVIGPETTSIMVAEEFHGRLELNTSNILAVNGFINMAIEDRGILCSINQADQQGKCIYTLNCSREDIGMFLSDLNSIWSEFESAKLFVNTEEFAKTIEVQAVNTEQIADIVKQDTSEKAVLMAKDLAVINNVDEHLPGTEILAAIDVESNGLNESLRMPRVRLTGGERKPIKQKDNDLNKVYLTIIVDR